MNVTENNVLHGALSYMTHPVYPWVPFDPETPPMPPARRPLV